MIKEILNQIVYVPSWFAVAIFIPALLFCLRHERRKYFWLRFIPCTISYFIIPYIVPDFYVSRFLSIDWFAFSYIICVLLTVGIMSLCFKVKLINLAFYVSVAYAMQNTAFNVYNLVFGFGRFADSAFRLSSRMSSLIGLLSYAAVYALGWFFFISRINTDFNNNKLRIRIAVISVIIVLVVYVLDMWLRNHRLLNLGTNIYAILVNTLLLSVQACVFRESRHETEKAILTELLRLEGKQHKISEQNINIIDIKFHDLKHRIEELRKNGSDDVNEIERAVDTYDAFVKSGNDVLDIVLTQKSLICKAKSMNLRIIADGQALSFMGDTDISALFGNILNNAIEAVENLEEDSRMISLNVFKQQGFIVIHEDNNFVGNLCFEDGLPVSNSGDPYFHGYGTKSIKLIAEKYGGTVSMHCDGKIFSLEIIIPDPV